MILNKDLLMQDSSNYTNIVNFLIPNLLICLVPPRWTVEPTDKQFAQGSDAKVDCKADGFPKPQISWKKAAGKDLIKLQQQKKFFQLLFVFRD